MWSLRRPEHKLRLKLKSLLVDTLLRTISQRRLRRWCFTDDIKFFANVTLCNSIAFLEEIDIVSSWSDEKQMPLSLDKCGVMHCGSLQPNNDYVIYGTTMSLLDSFKDLGVMRSANCLFVDQYSATAVKASKVADTIKHLFQQNTLQLLCQCSAMGRKFGAHMPCQRYKNN